MLSEYQWSGCTSLQGAPLTPLEYLIWRFPLRQAFCLYADACARYGVEQKGPSYVERSMVRAMREADAQSSPR